MPALSTSAPLAAQAAALLAQGDLSACRAALAQGLGVAPDDGEAWFIAAETSRAVGDMAGATRRFRRARRLIPYDIRPAFRLAATLGRLEARPEDRKATLDAYRACLIIDPACPEALFNLANTLHQTPGAADDAIRLFRAAWRARPDFYPAAAGLAMALAAVHRLSAALTACRAALALEPRQPDVLINAANALMAVGRPADGAAGLERALQLDPNAVKAFSNLLFLMCFDEDVDPEALLRRHRDFSDRFARPVAPAAPTYANDPAPERRLRVAFLAPSFRRHPGGHFLTPFFEHRNRDKFEVYAYYNGTYEDDRTRRFRALADHWRCCWDMNDAALADQIKADRIDVLVECAGHLADSRLLACARRPAPVQISFPIYPATTGLDGVGWRVMDVYFAGPDADRHHSERLIRLPHSHVCYEPSPGAPEPAAEAPMLKNGYATLASFNNFAKMGARTVALWAEILRRVPTARLSLKWQGLPTGDSADTLDRFAALGVDPARIILADWAGDPYSPYLDVDFCLDPLHANGGTTTCDALWMGVPVVTRVGSSPFSRVGLCHLSNVGLTETITWDDEAYVETAVALAGDPERLTRLRHGLRQRFQASPLMDQPRYVRNLEAALRVAWRRWCEEQDQRQVDAGRKALENGFARHQRGDAAGAAADYRRAQAASPADVDAMQLLGLALRAGKPTPDGRRRLERAAKLDLRHPGVAYNLGNARRDDGDLEKAVCAYGAALALDPSSADVWVSLGAVRQGQRRTAAAAAAYRRVVAINPAHAGAWMNLAWAQLISGDYRQGWETFEWRWRRNDFTSPQRHFSQPQWNGEPLEGRTLLLHAEQGFGDAVQFLRYAPMAMAAGGRVVLETPAALAPLVNASMPDLETIIAGEPPPPFDAHCPLMSLPRAFRTDITTIPAPRAYLRAPADRAAAWSAQVAAAATAGRLRVGVLWAGNPAFRGDRFRSPRLQAFLPLLATPGVDFFGLQMGEGRADQEGADLGAHFHDFGHLIKDFADTAAIMESLDLVISSCTAPAHLAAALGRPTWIALPYSPDWRWLLDRDDSPWYPTVRLFRQSRRGDWSDVADRLAAALRAYAARGVDKK